MSPVFSNIYLAEFDWIMDNESDFYIRYSDDMIVFGKKRQKLEDLLAKATGADTVPGVNGDFVCGGGI